MERTNFRIIVQALIRPYAINYGAKIKLNTSHNICVVLIEGWEYRYVVYHVKRIKGGNVYIGESARFFL